MSLLDRGPHTVVVTPAVRARDAYGAAVWSPGTPVNVRGSVQPVSAAESTDLGLTALTVYRFIGRSWPGGMHSSIEWNGRPWEQYGEAKIHGTGRGTRHVEVILQAKGAPVL